MTASPTDTLPRFQILLLSLLAAATLAVVRVETAWHPASAVLQVALEMGAAISLWLLVRNQAGLRRQPWVSFCTSLVCGLSYPLAIDSLQRWLGNDGVANEITMMISFQMAAIVFATFSFLPRISGLSIVLSSFLVLFTTTMSTDPVTFVLGGCFGVLGLWWLMGVYWDRIEDAFVASSVQRQVPVRASVIAVTGGVLCLLAALFATPGASAVVLQGFMPTSGGNHWHDEFARSGVGDGDAMVAAQDEALSFGPVESELFLDSDRPSLYDMFDDSYGEPPSLKRKQQMAVAIATQEQEEENERKMSQTKRSGREFSAVRRKAKRQREALEDRDAPAMLYVVGPTPLHLGLETYDAFDGRVWEHQVDWEPHRRPLLDQRFGKPWISFRPRFAGGEVHHGELCHALKLINLKTNRIPAPPHLTEVHIDQVDRLSFFGWTKDGMFEMSDREFIPQLTVIHLHSRGVSLEPLRGSGDFTQKFVGPPAKLKPYLEHSGDHAKIAEAWAEGTDRGWLQVEAIVRRLRNEFVHNPAAQAPLDCDDVVAHFLEAGEGPDYLFATTAASLLRSLGYPTRLVTGFYAKPERYDHRAGQTSVLDNDVHVWAEVCVDGVNWVTIEPTPGYQPPPEYMTWAQSLSAAVRWCGHWIRNNAIAASLSMVAFIAVVWWRQVWLDLIGWAICSLLGLPSVEAKLVWTLRLVEWRAYLVGRSRPHQRTIADWYSPLSASASGENRSAVHSFFDWSDRLLYSPQGIGASQRDEVNQACAAMVAASSRKSILLSLPVPTECF